MLNNEFIDLDAEHVVVYVSFQTLLFVDNAVLQEDNMRRVPVEGHYTVVADPWRPTRKEVYNNGFVHRPARHLFYGTKVCEREWINRLKFTHGIAPEVRLKEWRKKNDNSDWVVNSCRYFSEGSHVTGFTLFVHNKEANVLYEQLMDVFDVVERFKRKVGLNLSSSTVLFITLKGKVKMVQAALRWFAAVNVELPKYAVVAMEELIPASVDLFNNISDGARNPKFSRCAMHPIDYKNAGGFLFECCCADVSLLSCVGGYLADYLFKIAWDAPVIYDSESTDDDQCSC